MGTRCNVKIMDESDTIWFYRHSDGYPSGAVPTLWKFLTWLHEGRIRDNAEQSAGWLVLIGADEYKAGETISCEPGHDVNIREWKVGAYEPCLGRHGDIEYEYEIDLKTKELRCFRVHGFGEKNRTLELIATFSKQNPPTEYGLDNL